MSQKWNLQDIRPIDKRTRTAPPSQATLVRPVPPPQADDVDDIAPVVIEDGNKRRKFRYLWVSTIATLLIVGAVVLSVVFSETTVTVKPINREPNVNAEFEAFKERREGALTYEVLTLESTKEKQVKATGEKQVEEQAKGTIEILKTTPGAERLIKNTRFKSPEGLIFRIEESVVVPGAVEKDGKMNPGSIRAPAFAEAIGEQYNLPSGTRFTIPGFEENKLTDLFESMYAIAPEGFTGGFDGPQFIIDESELSTARQQLQLELRDELLARIKQERPAEFVAFEGSYAFTYNQLPPASFGGDLVSIKEQAVLQVPLFKSSELASFIAAQTVPTYNKNPVRIQSYDNMLFSYADPNNKAAVIANLPSLVFTIVGKPHIIWEYDEKQLRADLAGKSKTAVPTIQDAYSGSIVSFTVSMKPFYRQSFPENGDDIRVIEVIEQSE